MSSEFVKKMLQLKSSNYIVAYLHVLGATKYMEDDSEQIIPQYVIQDNDGEWYLNSFFINGFGCYEKYKTSILNLLQENSNNRKTKQKLNWLVSYFNHFYCSQTCDDEPQHEPISLLDINKTTEEENNLCNEVSNG